MPEPHDPNETVDHSSTPADSLDGGLAAGFGRPADGPGSVLSQLRTSLGPLRPVLLKEAEGESELVVKPNSDAMPTNAEAGNRYQLSGEIARGGMGAVLRGRDVDLGRDLAVKVLLEKYADRPEVARRFIEEAQIGGQLQHPGVVPVYDIGRFGDRPFFTMKLVKGQTLAHLLAERADPTQDRPRLLGIALQVAQAKAYAHAKGVIHRDLKPANIMVGAFGEVQVMDWGLAKVLAEGGVADEERASRAHHTPDDVTTIRTARSTGSAGSLGTDTEAGSLLGTPAYMPPEQANGDIANLDRRADVFGLGAILCEILTGKPPYVGRSSEEVRRKAANGDLADANVRLVTCGADAELISLTRKCLSPEAIDRPKDAQEVADGLSAYLNGVQERLQTAERERAVAVVREAEQRKKRKVQLALAAALFGLLLCGGAFAFWRIEQAQLVHQREARNAEAVATLLNQCEEAIRSNDAAKAAVVFEAAKKRSAEGGAEKDAARLKRLDDDLTLLRDLDAVDQFRWTLVNDRFSVAEYPFPDAAAVATRTWEALKRFGADPDAVTVDEAAARMAASVARERIVPALDRLLMPIRLVDLDELSAREQGLYPPQMWADVATLVPKTLGARAVLRKVDADPYRDAVRDAVIALDRAKFVEVAGQAVALEQPPGFVAFLGESQVIDLARRRQLLQAAVHRRPGDLGLLMTLGGTYPVDQEEGVDERLRWFQAAVAVGRDNLAAHGNLARALWQKGQLDEAIAYYRTAIELQPRYASAYVNLADALRSKGERDELIACYRKAIEVDPKYVLAIVNLGNALKDKGQLDDAIACFRKAIEIEPNGFVPHYNLGLTLVARGQGDEAIASLRKAIELFPTHTWSYYHLGAALKHKGQLDEAIASLRRATELDPEDASSQTQLAKAERMAVARDKLPAFQNGRYSPATNEERLDLAEWCQIKTLNHTAAALYAAAFAADPKLADDLQAQPRYNAACHAALAAAGQGDDAAKLDDAERTRLRKQALDWLRADLALWTQQLDTGTPADRAAALKTLSHWQQDTDLAGIRNKAALEMLPEDERKDWQALWAEVDALLKQTPNP